MRPFKATRDPLDPMERQMRRLASNGTERIAAMLRDVAGDLFDDLTEAQIDQVFTRLNGDATREKMTAVLGELVEEWAVAGAKFGVGQVASAVSGISVDWTMANMAAAEWAKQYTFELVKGITDTTQNALQKEVASFAADQGTIGQLRDNLAPHFGEQRAKVIAITETTRAFAEGNREAWAASGVVEDRKWLTNRDDIVCVICRPMDGQVTGIDEPWQHPDGYAIELPGHVGCRCGSSPSMSRQRQREIIQDEIAFIEGATEDVFADIRPPEGRAPRGKGEEYKIRRRIISRIETHVKWKAQADDLLREYSGQSGTRARWRIDVAKERSYQLQRAISTMLDISTSSDQDWQFADELTKGIADHISELRTFGQ